MQRVFSSKTLYILGEISYHIKVELELVDISALTK